MKDYGQVHDLSINSMVVTINNENLYTSSLNGFLIKWSIGKQQIVKDFGNVHEDGIHAMCVTKDNEYLFTSDWKGF